MLKLLKADPSELLFTNNNLDILPQIMNWKNSKSKSRLLLALSRMNKENLLLIQDFYIQSK